MSWEAVYRVVKAIPRGRVTTYGELARVLRLRGGARAAGHAMAVCPTGEGIPWHRVVGAGGSLLIREPHAGLQAKLLAAEGIQVAGRSIDMKRHAWHAVAKNRKSTRKTTRAKSRVKRCAQS